MSNGLFAAGGTGGNGEGRDSQEICIGEGLMGACLGGRCKRAETNMSNELLTAGVMGGDGEGCGSGGAN